MYKLAIGIAFGLMLFSNTAMATCSSYPYTLTNGTTADAGQVMANFNCAALTSGATINAATLTGTTAFPGSGVIASSGNIGIGTASPNGPLDVYSGSTAGNILTRLNDASSTTGSGIAIGALATNEPFVGFRVSDQSQRFQINVVSVNTSSERLAFSGDCGGGCGMTEYFSINKGGYVGIGTTSPSSPLMVVGGSGYVGAFNGTNNTAYSTSTYAGIDTLFLDNLSTTAGTGAGISFGVKGAGPGAVATIAGISTAADYSTALVFQTRSSSGTDAEQMRITATGNVGIGTTSPSYTLHVNGSVAGTSAYNNLSDVRLKKNIVSLVGGLSLIGQLQPVRFDWRSEREREVGKDFKLPAGRQIGFVAQDVGKVLPEAVSIANGKDAIMSVAESKVVPVLVAAVKELKAENDNQAAEIGRLETEVTALERKVRMQTAQR
jgi:hypothetical protein